MMHSDAFNPKLGKICTSHGGSPRKGVFQVYASKSPMYKEAPTLEKIASEKKKGSGADSLKSVVSSIASLEAPMTPRQDHSHESSVQIGTGDGKNTANQSLEKTDERKSTRKKAQIKQSSSIKK